MISRISAHLRPFYSETGRPSIDPELMNRMLLIGYATNYLIDLDHAVIVDFEASRAIRQAEVGSARTMLDRTQERFGLWPARLAADSAHGSVENLAWLVHERGIEPHIPVFDKSQRSDGTFSRSDFAYDHAQDLYTCPEGGSPISPALRHQPRGRRSRRLHALPRPSVCG